MQKVLGNPLCLARVKQERESSRIQSLAVVWPQTLMRSRSSQLSSALSNSLDPLSGTLIDSHALSDS